MKRLLTLLTLAALAGCQRNAVLIPNSDPTLNRTAISFAQAAAERFPYPADIEHGGEVLARAEIGYMWNVINAVNFSKQDWTDVELWVNQSYVIPLASWKNGEAKKIAFKMIYNDQGQPFPDGNIRIDTLELKLNGKMYRVPKQIGG